jgi:hypothetical protein
MSVTPGRGHPACHLNGHFVVRRLLRDSPQRAQHRLQQGADHGMLGWFGTVDVPDRAHVMARRSGPPRRRTCRAARPRVGAPTLRATRALRRVPGGGCASRRAASRVGPAVPRRAAARRRRRCCCPGPVASAGCGRCRLPRARTARCRSSEGVTEFQIGFARAGHATAGVLLVLSLTALTYAETLRCSGGSDPGARWLLRSLDGRGRTRPNGLVAVVFAGAIVLAAGLASLGIGLLTAG